MENTHETSLDFRAGVRRSRCEHAGAGAGSVGFGLGMGPRRLQLSLRLSRQLRVRLSLLLQRILWALLRRLLSAVLGVSRGATRSLSPVVIVHKLMIPHRALRQLNKAATYSSELFAQAVHFITSGRDRAQLHSVPLSDTRDERSTL